MVEKQAPPEKFEKEPNAQPSEQGLNYNHVDQEMKDFDSLKSSAEENQKTIENNRFPNTQIDGLDKLNPAQQAQLAYKADNGALANTDKNGRMRDSNKPAPLSDLLPGCTGFGGLENSPPNQPPKSTDGAKGSDAGPEQKPESNEQLQPDKSDPHGQDQEPKEKPPGADRPYPQQSSDKSLPKDPGQQAESKPAGSDKGGQPPAEQPGSALDKEPNNGAQEKPPGKPFECTGKGFGNGDDLGTGMPSQIKSDATKPGNIMAGDNPWSKTKGPFEWNKPGQGPVKTDRDQTKPQNTDQGDKGVIENKDPGSHLPREREPKDPSMDKDMSGNGAEKVKPTEPWRCRGFEIPSGKPEHQGGKLDNGVKSQIDKAEGLLKPDNGQSKDGLPDKMRNAFFEKTGQRVFPVDAQAQLMQKYGPRFQQILNRAHELSSGTK